MAQAESGFGHSAAEGQGEEVWGLGAALQLDHGSVYTLTVCKCVGVCQDLAIPLLDSLSNKSLNLHWSGCSETSVSFTLELT